MLPSAIASSAAASISATHSSMQPMCNVASPRWLWVATGTAAKIRSTSPSSKPSSSSRSRELAWTSITGIDQRGRWRLRERPRDDGTVCTWVELRLTAGVAGSGLFGWLAEQFAAPTVRGHLRRSLQQLKRQVEHEELRARAAARRRARAAASS